MRDYCACCEADCTTNQWVSGLYNPNDRDIILCEYCGEQEEKAIEHKGTNDIPELLATYRR